jgi:hypothetical protein
MTMNGHHHNRHVTMSARGNRWRWGRTHHHTWTRPAQPLLQLPQHGTAMTTMTRDCGIAESKGWLALFGCQVCFFLIYLFLLMTTWQRCHVTTAVARPPFAGHEWGRATTSLTARRGPERRNIYILLIHLFTDRLRGTQRIAQEMSSTTSLGPQVSFFFFFIYTIINRTNCTLLL